MKDAMGKLDNVYICGAHFIISRTDARNGADIIFTLTWFQKI